MMKMGPWLLHLCAVSATLLLVACGGGGGGTSTSGDIATGGPRGAAQATGLDRFLLNPNPLVRADGLFEVGEVEYANAYYESIDPTNAKDTLSKWKVANNIGVTSGGHTEISVIIGDQRDLGYGRRMVAHRNPDGTLAFLVENYLVGAYGGYTPLNLEAAITRASKWHLGTNAIEFSPGPKAGTVVGTDLLPADGNFVKFYTYDPVTEQRLTTLSLDGRPDKAMPTVCTTCHGGRGDPLTPADPVTGKKLFALVENGYSKHRGDTQSQLHPFEPASFDYSTIPGFSRAEQEAAMKAINKLILCSMSLPNGTVKTTPGFPAEDQCRRVATINEYQGTAAPHLKDMYGGVGMPNPTSSSPDSYVEASWLTAGQSTLYLNVQAEACRVCHLLRGTGNQSDVSFDTFAQFDSYKDRIKAHMVDRGNMPLAKLIYDKYWSTPSMFQTMGTYLLNAGFADGASMPGRPIADPGPNRVVKQGASSLSASMSLYADTFQWALTSNPGGAANLTGASTAQATFNATADGEYQVQLIASKGAATSAPATLTIVVNSNPLVKAPTSIRFADVKAVLQIGTGQCTTCHQKNGNGSKIPPIWYSSYDRAGTGVGTESSVVNDHWFYTELRGRINFTDIIASPLLRKPAGHHHGANVVPGVLARAGFDTSLRPGDAGRADYDLILNWILNGAPQ